jgi:hypothetical protein
MPPRSPVRMTISKAVMTATGIDQPGSARLKIVYVMPPPTPASSSRLNGMPNKPFSSRSSTWDLKSAAIVSS